MIEVTLTGTGTPVPSGDRAGAGVLVRTDDALLQFDAGRATTLRLAAAGVRLGDVDAVFVTHHHSDHLVGLPDLAMTRWVGLCDDPLEVVAPAGPSSVFAERMLDVWDHELAARAAHGGRTSRAAVSPRAFDATPEPTAVWSRGSTTVLAVAVHHEPVQPAVAYRVQCGDHAVVISGDTVACDEVEQLAAGADVLVHEAVRTSVVAGTPFAFVTQYHADACDVGALAARAGVGHLVLTHLIPAPANERHAQGFADDVRRGGYTGPLAVGHDLFTVAVGSGEEDLTVRRRS